MSEARAPTTFAGNAVATVLIGTWTGAIDEQRAALVLRGGLPFDESMVSDDDHGRAEHADAQPVLPPKVPVSV